MMPTRSHGESSGCNPVTRHCDPELMSSSPNPSPTEASQQHEAAVEALKARITELEDTARSSTEQANPDPNPNPIPNPNPTHN